MRVYHVSHRGIATSSRSLAPSRSTHALAPFVTRKYSLFIAVFLRYIGRIYWIAFMSLGLAICCKVGRAQPAVGVLSEAPKVDVLSQDKAIFVLHSMWHSRQTISSSRINITASFENASAGDAKAGNIHEEIEYFVAADTVKKRFRIDQVTSKNTWQFVKRPEWLLTHPWSSAVISRYAPDFEVPWEEGRILDPRVIGAAHRDAVMGLTLKELRSYFPDKSAIVRESEPGIFAIRWDNVSQQHPELTVITRLWCDEKLGFAPTRVTQTSGLNGKFPPSPDLSSTTSYTRLDNVFVPATCVYETRRNGILQPIETWDLEWEQLNEDIDQAVFSAKGLDARGGTLVVDKRLGGSLIEFEIERDGIDDLPGGAPKPLGKGGLADSGISSFWLAANIIVVVLLLGLLVLKYRRGSPV